MNMRKKSDKSDTDNVTNKKQSFDFSRVGGFFNVDPITDLRIIGGKSLPAEEAGDLDTDDGPTHTLWDSRNTMALKKSFVANVDYNGVLETVLVAKIDGVATVVAGRRRVRAARAVNRQRKERGEPEMKVEIKIVRPSSDARMLGISIAENEARFDDDIATKILKVKQLKERGVDDETVAIQFDTTVTTIRNWLDYDDNAVSSVKKAVESGKISQTSGWELSTIKDSEKQKAALDEILANAGSLGTSQREVKQAKAKVTNKRVGVSDKMTQKRILTAIVESPRSTKDESQAFWNGAAAAIKLILGEEGVDPRMGVLLTQVREAAKKAKPRKRKGEPVEAVAA
jgi:ParB-like chromosome segregation protein Spo0J